MLKAGLIFLLDVDNTLFDNDRFAADLKRQLIVDFGSSGCEQFWAIYETLRDELGYADYLGSVQRFRQLHPGHAAVLRLSGFMLDYPFASHLFPRALEVIAHLNTLGSAVILSDGDAVFQPRKVQASGIAQAVSGRVLIYVHKQHSFGDLQARYPAAHYVMIDDKPQLLAAIKQALGAAVTTVFVEQGHYARDAIKSGLETQPDGRVACIGDLLAWSRERFLPAPRA